MNADEVKTSVDKMETTNEETNNHNIMNADETKTSVDETKPVVDETETTNDEAKSTAIIASKDLVVRISNVKYPRQGIKLVTAERYLFGAIKNAARQQFLQKGSMVKPVLKNVTYDSVTGCVLVECADEETREWLHKVTPKIGKGRGNIPPLKVVITTLYPTVHPQSTAVATNSLIVAISRLKYPKQHLRPTQATQVVNNLTKQALRQFRQKQSKIKPVLQNTTFDSVTGCVMVECADQATLGWVHKFVQNMGLSKGGINVKVVSEPVAVKQKGRKGTASSEAATDILDDNVPKAFTDDVHSDNVPQDPTDNIYDDNVPQGSEGESEMDESEDEPTFIGSLNQNGTYSGNSNRGGNSSGNLHSSGNYRDNSNRSGNFSSNPYSDGNSNANRNRNGSNSNGGSSNSCNEGNSFTRATFEERFDNSNRSNSGNSLGGSSNSYNEGFGGNYSTGEGKNLFSDERNWNTSGNSSRNWNRSVNYGDMVGNSGNSYDRRNYSSEGDKNASNGRNWNTNGNFNRNWNQSGNSSSGSTRFDDANSFGDEFGRSNRNYPGDSYGCSDNSYNEANLFSRGNYATEGGRNNFLDGGNWSNDRYDSNNLYQRRTTLEANASTGSRGSNQSYSGAYSDGNRFTDSYNQRFF